VAVLTDEHEVSRTVDGRDRGGSDVPDDLELDLATVGKRHVLDVQPDHAPVVHASFRPHLTPLHGAPSSR
jgi:hypothetical protein